jgi:hypothetical protein
MRTILTGDGPSGPDASLFPVPYHVGPAEMQVPVATPVHEAIATTDIFKQLALNGASDLGGLAPYLVLYILFRLSKSFEIRSKSAK